jgi:hypothetical protein
MELSGYIVGWVLVTTIVVALGFYRLTLGLHEVLGVRFNSPDESDDTEFYKQQGKIERKMEAIDKIGVALTAVSAILAVIITLMWAAASGGSRAL